MRRACSPRGGGLAIVEGLAATAEKIGVEFFYETTANDLILDEDGEVAGVRATIKGSGPAAFLGRAIVLASGGYEGNPEMLAQYMGPRALYLRPIARGGYYNKGEGIRMALRIGAAPCGDFSSYHAEPIDPRSGVPEPRSSSFPTAFWSISKGGASSTKHRRRSMRPTSGSRDRFSSRPTASPM